MKSYPSSPPARSVLAIASANPRALPFTYTTDTLAQGQVEIEQYVDLDPLQQRDRAPRRPPTREYTSRVGVPDRDRDRHRRSPRARPLLHADPRARARKRLRRLTFPGTGNGIKQRLRYIFADPNEWPIDVGLYGEVTENEREVEVEGKLLLQRRFGDVRVAANLSSEYEYYYSAPARLRARPVARRDVRDHPEAATPASTRFLRGEYPLHPKPATRTFGLGPEAYVGPAVMMNFGKLWWAVSAYAPVADLEPRAPARRALRPVLVPLDDRLQSLEGTLSVFGFLRRADPNNLAWRGRFVFGFLVVADVASTSRSAKKPKNRKRPHLGG